MSGRAILRRRHLALIAGTAGVLEVWSPRGVGVNRSDDATQEIDELLVVPTGVGVNRISGRWRLPAPGEVVPTGVGVNQEPRYSGSEVVRGPHGRGGEPTPSGPFPCRSWWSHGRGGEPIRSNSALLAWAMRGPHGRGGEPFIDVPHIPHGRIRGPHGRGGEPDDQRRYANPIEPTCGPHGRGGEPVRETVAKFHRIASVVPTGVGVNRPRRSSREQTSVVPTGVGVNRVVRKTAWTLTCGPHGRGGEPRPTCSQP